MFLTVVHGWARIFLCGVCFFSLFLCWFEWGSCVRWQSSYLGRFCFISSSWEEEETQSSVFICSLWVKRWIVKSGSVFHLLVLSPVSLVRSSSVFSSALFNSSSLCPPPFPSLNSPSTSLSSPLLSSPLLSSPLLSSPLLSSPLLSSPLLNSPLLSSPLSPQAHHGCTQRAEGAPVAAAAAAAAASSYLCPGIIPTLWRLSLSSEQKRRLLCSHQTRFV